MGTKICPKCREEKPLGEFYTDASQSSGYATYCKKCSLIAAKEWREKNKERVKELRRNWNEENKLTVFEQNKKRTKKWRSNKDNREKANAKSREYKKKNREIINVGERRRRENCSPCYIKGKLKKQGFLDNQITPELIEEKRNIIKVKRVIKQIKNKQNYE